MHTFLRAIGFSEYKSKRQLNDLIAEAVLKAEEKLYTSLNNDTIFAEYNLFCGNNIGISVRGEYDEENQFLADYSIPFFRGSQISSYADNSVERHAEKESYAGICDDVRIGVSLIFYLQNVVGYVKRKVGGKLPMKGTALTLAGIGMYVYSYFITSEVLKAALGLITIYLIVPNILISYFQFGNIESICRHYKKKKLS